MRSRTKWILFNLDSAVDHERLQAIIQAGESDDPRVLQALVNIATCDPANEHRHHARRAITTIRQRLTQGVMSVDGPSVMVEMGQLSQALASRDPQVRVKAIQAMAACDLPQKEEIFRKLMAREKDAYARSELVKSLVLFDPKVALPLVLEFLPDPDPRVKVNAVEALESLGTAQAFEHVVPLLLSTEEKVRKAATLALNRFGKANLLKVLQKMLGDSRAPARDAAVHALALVRLSEALPLLAQAMKDPVAGIRAKAAEGLELLARQGVVEADALLEAHALSTTGGVRPGHEGEMSAILERGELLEPVADVNTLEDYDPDKRLAEIKKIIRSKAYERAAEIGTRIKIEQDKNVLSCLVLALGRLKAREYVGVVRKHLKSTNDRIRANAVQAMALMDDRTLLPELKPLLADANNRVRVNAILALRGQAGHDPHALLATCLEAPEQPLRRSALYGLLELADDPAVRLLERVLKDRDAIVRETAMEFLGILKSEGHALAAHVYEQAHAQGLRPPQDGPASITRSSRGGRLPKHSLDELLYYVNEIGASDLHLNVGVEPCVRLHGYIRRVRSLPLSSDDTKRMLFAILSEEQIVRLEKAHSLDLSYAIAGVARFRVNVFRELRGYKGVFRVVPMDLPTLDGLGLPATFKRFCHHKQGLVLVTGPTGMGKSTTLAAMVNEINSTEQKHIITIEDPIEFLHPHRMSVISQRELGVHAHSFAVALRDSLREDPNVILVGEMRDLETMSLAVTAAETGHLVFSTLHTSSAAQSINRIVDVFPPNQQEQARLQLSNSLQAIVSQRLVPAAVGEGRLLAFEIMTSTPAIANLIREGKTEQLYTVIQVSHDSGMITLDSHLAQLVASGQVARTVAVEYALDRKSFLASLKPAK